MHDDFHAFLLGIALQFGYIEIGVGLVEIVNEFLAVSIVVFPAFVPAFHQHGVKPVLRGEVDVFFHVCRVGSVVSVRFQFRIIGLAITMSCVSVYAHVEPCPVKYSHHTPTYFVG